MHALVIDGQVVKSGRLPASAKRLDNGNWIMGLATAPAELVEACGWYPVAATDPPAHDDATETVVSSLAFDKGGVVQTWTVAPLDADTLAAKAREAVRGTLETRLRGALAINTGYLALAAPTATQTRDEVRALARQVNALIRREFPDLTVDSSDV